MNPVNEFLINELKKVTYDSRVESHNEITCVIHSRSAGLLNEGGYLNSDAEIQVLDNKGQLIADIYSPRGATSSAVTDDGQFLLITYGGDVGEDYEIFKEGFSLLRIADQKEIFNYTLKGNESYLNPAVVRLGMIFIAFSSSYSDHTYNYFIIDPHNQFYYHAKFTEGFRTRLIDIDEKGFYANMDGAKVFKPYSSFEKVAF